jgi:FMN phosphatase YigB (HAD superfamily)
MSRFEAVFFDMGGTVLEIRGVASAYREILARHGYHASDAQVHRWLAEARAGATALPAGIRPDLTIDARREHARREATVGALLDFAGVQAGREACREEIWSSWVGTKVFGLYPDAAEVLTVLKRAGLVIGAVSNWEPRLPELCANHGIAQYFDFILASEAEGHAKPGTRLFELALDRAGVLAGAAVHVGDHPLEDVQAAQAAGISAVLLRREEAGPSTHSPSINSLDALLPLVLCDGWLRGRVVTGKGEAEGFTKLPWVRRQVAERLGFDLYPGTLNLRVERPKDASRWLERRQQAGLPIEPSPGFCAARCFPVSVEGRFPGAIVLPEVPGYPTNVAEVIAPIALRAALPAQDGDELTLALSPVAGRVGGE